MSEFLQQMATLSAERAAAAAAIRAADLDKPIVPLRLDRFGIIAEIKDRSPAEGALAKAGQSRVERAKQYAAGGAAAISVLTEPSQFAGDLSHVEEVAAALPGTPVMRKDFLVDTVQILEARAAAASGVLLIVTMLSDKKLRNMLACAREHGLFVLLESFDEEDLSRAAAVMNAAIWTDDSWIAQFGTGQFGIRSVWSHALLLYALKSGSIAEDLAADATLDLLADLGRNRVAVNQLCHPLTRLRARLATEESKNRRGKADHGIRTHNLSFTKAALYR